MKYQITYTKLTVDSVYTLRMQFVQLQSKLVYGILLVFQNQHMKCSYISHKSWVCYSISFGATCDIFRWNNMQIFAQLFCIVL